jgi:hypothetical protein
METERKRERKQKGKTPCMIPLKNKGPPREKTN